MSANFLPTRRAPTHTLRVEVPLCLESPEHAEFDAAADAVRAVLAVSRAAYVRTICDDIQVTMDTVERGWDETAQRVVGKDECCPVCGCLVDHTSGRFLPFCQRRDHRRAANG